MKTKPENQSVRISKTFRLDSELCHVLHQDASRREISEREAVEIILRDHYLHGNGLAERVAQLEELMNLQNNVAH